MNDLSSALKLACTKSIGRSSLILKKHSPEILTGVGILGVVTSAVLAAKATLGLEDVIDEIQTSLADVEDKKVQLEVYSDQDYAKDKLKAYVHGSFKIAKLYGPAVTLGLASISCIVAAHGIMKKRNVALAAAYKSVEEAFNKYRERVIEELGEEQERDIRLGVREEEVTDEDGKKSIKHSMDPTRYSAYAKIFDEGNKNWSKEPELNRNFIQNVQNYANDRLHARGYVFLNEVYKDLGLPITKAGQVVGWYLSGEGDNYIDFGMFDVNNEMAREFVNGYERSIVLDFNVDGDILNKI